MKKPTPRVRRLKKTRQYELIDLKIKMGDLKITEELMQSIRSPKWQPIITNSIFRRMVEPEKCLKEAWAQLGSDLCLCRYYSKPYPKPLASAWNSPHYLIKLRDVNRLHPGKAKLVRVVRRGLGRIFCWSEYGL